MAYLSWQQAQLAGLSGNFIKDMQKRYGTAGAIAMIGGGAITIGIAALIDKKKRDDKKAKIKDRAARAEIQAEAERGDLEAKEAIRLHDEEVKSLRKQIAARIPLARPWVRWAQANRSGDDLLDVEDAFAAMNDVDQEARKIEDVETLKEFVARVDDEGRKLRAAVQRKR